jgi:hypothetical protein
MQWTIFDRSDRAHIIIFEQVLLSGWDSGAGFEARVWSGDASGNSVRLRIHEDDREVRALNRGS